MKNTAKFGGIVALAAVICFFAAGCEDSEPAHVHDYEWTVTVPATCIAKGVETGICKLDPSHTTTREIPIDLVNGHDWGEWTGTVTCTEAGTGTRVCSRNESHIETNNNLQPLGHAYNDEDWEVTEPSTCTAKGKEEANCVRYAECGNTGTREIAIDPTAHNWQLSPTATAPTCTEDGNGDQVCSYNQEHIQSGVIPKLGHDSGEWHITLEPDCTTAGSKELRCTRDSVVLDTETIVALGHDYQNYIETTAPTCTTAGVETGTCTHDNNHTTTRPKAINPTAHNWNGYTITTSATCSATGIETDTCSYNPEHTRTQTVAIDSNAHDWNTAYTTIPATETADGIKVITCKHNNSHTKDAEFSGEYATGTAGLMYELIDSSTAYSVSGGTVTEGEVYLPTYHRPDVNSDYLLVTTISMSAFSDTNITAITIPASITYLGAYAMYNCTSLASINVDASSTILSSHDGILYDKEKTLLIQAPQKINGSVIIPATVTAIGNSAFINCTSLETVVFAVGSQVQSIGDNTFNGCTSLTEITIPSSVTSISTNGVFTGCASLTGINVDALNTVYSSHDGILYDKEKTTLIKAPWGKNGGVTIPATVTTINGGAFSACKITAITIPASVSSIGAYAFNGCYDLVSVTFVGTIPNSGFYSYNFPGDLRAKFYATNADNGTPGTYIVTSGIYENSVWELQD